MGSLKFDLLGYGVNFSCGQLGRIESIGSQSACGGYVIHLFQPFKKGGGDPWPALQNLRNAAHWRNSA